MIAASMMLAVFNGRSTEAQDTAADEDEIRAAMLFNLTKFIDWPAWRLADSGSAFTVCLLGSDATTEAIDRLMRNKAVDGRSIIVRRLNRSQDGTVCHIVFFAHSARNRFEELAPGLAKASVVTVGDQEWFAGSGGIVGLPLVEGRIHIEINLGAAQRSNLCISSKLLRLATVVK